MKFIIYGKDLKDFETGKLLYRLPGMNDIITWSKKGSRKYQPYQDAKRYYGMIIQSIVRKLPKFDKVCLDFVWYEPNARRDPDNIMSGGTKFILDSLVKANIIYDDSQKYIKGISHKVVVDRKNPRIEVEIKECNL